MMAAIPQLVDDSPPSPRVKHALHDVRDPRGSQMFPTAFLGLEAFRLPGHAARAVVSGSAGSGKTTLLRHVAELLAAEGMETTTLSSTTDIGDVPTAVVVLADDVHRLADDRVAALAGRAGNPDAGLLIAVRTWPARPDIAALCRVLERSRPAIVLDEAGAWFRAGEAGFGACDDDILHLTGGIAWLVHECRALHDPVACRDDRDHHALRRAIRPRILHRLMSAPPRVRKLVEELSLAVMPTIDPGMSADDATAVIAEGYAEGLLAADGRPAPAMAAAIRDMTSTARLMELVRTCPAAALSDDGLAGRLDGIHDRRAAEAFLARARTEMAGDPRLASALLDRAVACGADPSALALDRARAAWRAHDVDAAGAVLDGMLAAGDAPAEAVDLAAAVWAERGLVALAAATYRACPTDGPVIPVRARIAEIGAGRWQDRADGAFPPGRAAAAGGDLPPSALGAAHALLESGLTAAQQNRSATAIADLRRASELYTASGDDSPTVELPAVIGAVASMGVGDVRSAQAIIDEALRGGHGGSHARPRLQLWASWIAVQQERPLEARTALARATSDGALTPRDDALAAAISIGLARRYEDAAGLSAEWDASLPRVTRTEPDLFTALPLSELVIASARVGDAGIMQPAFDRALAIASALGDPAIWSSPLHWAGIQRGILLNRPDALAPHARALVAAAPHNRLAACMAHAGRVWTAVLSGTVDADSVEQAARGLAGVGMAWDGARLAGHGASRAEDRKVIARLLSCARELHPRETPRAAEEGQDNSVKPTAGEGLLSEREREVAELVLQGKTYAEIGATIFISPRTAEHHIAHIRRRLDATSRSDLLSKLRIALDGGAVDTARGGSPG